MTGLWRWMRHHLQKMAPAGSSAGSLTLGAITRTWYPLALSWTVMSLEGVISSAFLARLPDPEISLAAYGGVSFAIAFVISSPISMMLSASTAISKNLQAYYRLRKFMMLLGLALTLIYLIVAFTPVYYWVVEQLIGAPTEIIEPGRLGLMILLPFPWLIGYRRLQQGVMIRFGQSGGVTACTFLRIISESLLMLIGFLDGRLPGIVIATGSQVVGMVLETIYASLRVRPILKYEMKTIPVENELTWKELVRFYVPLSMTTIIGFSFQFINSAGLSRMPLALESLAVYPVVSGLSWLLQGPGVALNEVVVALLDRPRSVATLRRFTLLLFAGSLLLTLLFLVTPLSIFWFTHISSLAPNLVQMANNTLWIMLASSGLCVLQCWFQALIVHGRKTRFLSESIVVALIVEVVIIIAGVAYGRMTGVYVGTLGMVISYAAQVFWLWLRSRPLTRGLVLRDAESAI